MNFFLNIGANKVVLKNIDHSCGSKQCSLILARLTIHVNPYIKKNVPTCILFVT